MNPEYAGEKRLSHISLIDVRPDLGKRLPNSIIDSIHKFQPPEQLGKIIQSICGDVGCLVDEDICQDLVLDAMEIENTGENSTLFYPPEEMVSASVISFLSPDELAKNTFVQLMMQSLRATHRSGQSNLRVSIITGESSFLGHIDFINERDYWCCVSAIKRTIDGDDDVNFSGKCLLATGSEKDGQPKKSTLFGMVAATSNSQELKDIFIASSQLRIMDFGKELFRVQIDEVKAIALARDFEPINPIIMEISLRSNADIQLCPLDSEGQLLPTISPSVMTTSQFSVNDTIAIPVSNQSISNNYRNFGTHRIGLLSYSRMYDADPSGLRIEDSVAIPFDELLGSNSSTGSSDGIAGRSRLEDSNDILSLVDRSVIREITVKSTSELPAAYRMLILGVDGLAPGAALPPSAYCTVYLVNGKGEKLTVNTVEARTEVIPRNSDPKWTKEFLLRAEEDNARKFNKAKSLEAPTGVMIKVRDAAAGMFKHKHLGQVIVPINCFIYQTEATFCLPLEATDRMGVDGNVTVASGQIHLTTQLVSLADQGNLPSTRRRLIRRAPSRRPSTYSSSQSETREITPPNESGTFKVCESKVVVIGFTLKKTSPWLTWWPMRVLQFGDCKGHVNCSFGAMSIRLFPGAGGILPTCDDAGSPDDDGMIVVSVPWNHVTSAVELSESALLVCAMVTYNATPSDGRRSSFQQSTAEVNILIGPCPATQLRLVISHRIAIWGIRSHFKTLAVSVHNHPSLQMSCSDLKPMKYSNVSMDNQKLKRSSTSEFELRAAEDVLLNFNTDDIDGILALARIVAEMLEAVVADTEPSVNLICRSQDITQSSSSSREVVESDLTDKHLDEKRIHFTWSASLSRISSSEFNQQSSVCLSPSSHAINVAQRITTGDFDCAVQACKYLRARTYLGLMLYTLRFIVPPRTTSSTVSSVQFPRSDARSFAPSRVLRQSTSNVPPGTLPEYSTESARYFVEIDLARASLQIANRGELSRDDVIDNLVERHNNILELAVRRIRDYILCSFHYLQQPKRSQLPVRQPSALTPPRPPVLARNNSLNARGVANTLVVPNSVNSEFLESLEELISLYHNALRMLLLPLVNTRDSFCKLKGQLLKSTFLKVLIEKNSEFDSRVQPVLKAVGLSCAPRLLLVEMEGMQIIVDWFSKSLISETKIWLENTIKMCTSNRKNKYGIPWDIEVIPRKKLVSDLPETIMSILNVYLALCSDEIDSVAYDYIESHKDHFNQPTTRSFNNSSNVPTTRINDDILSTDSSTAIQSAEVNPEDGLGEPEESHKELKRSLTKGGSFRNIVKTQLKRTGTLMDMMASVGGSFRHNKLTKSPSAKDLVETESAYEQEGIVFKHVGDQLSASGGKSSHVEGVRKSSMDKAIFLLRMNEKILSAVAQCLLLLVDEYRRSLQRKHWDKGDYDNGEFENNMNFLISIGNDCVRIVDNHIFPMKSIKTLETAPFDLFVEVICESRIVEEHAARALARMLLAPVQPILLDYENQWSREDGNLLVKQITRSLLQEYASIRTLTEESLYNRMVGNCAEVCCLRYLFMLRKRGEMSSKLTSTEVLRLSEDVDHLVEFFQLEPETDSSNMSAITAINSCRPQTTMRATRSLQALREARDLLCLSFESESYLSLVRSIVRRYRSVPPSAGYTNIASNILMCLCNIVRPDSSPEATNITFTILENHGTSKSSTLPEKYINEDMLVRVFASKVDDDSGFFSAGSYAKKTVGQAMQSTLITPGAALKQLREKAADITTISDVLGMGKQHKMEKKLAESQSESQRTSRLDEHAVDVSTTVDSRSSTNIFLNDHHSHQRREEDSDGDDSTIAGEGASVFEDYSADASYVLVTEIKLRGVRSTTLFGAANPYVSISVGNQRSKTAVIWGGKEVWAWNHLAMEFQVSMAKLSTQKLVVRVYDKERIRRKRLLGGINISLDGISAETGVHNWFALDGNDSGSGGEIFLGIQINSHRLSKPVPTTENKTSGLLRSFSSSFMLSTNK